MSQAWTAQNSKSLQPTPRQIARSRNCWIARFRSRPNSKADPPKENGRDRLQSLSRPRATRSALAATLGGRLLSQSFHKLRLARPVDIPPYIDRPCARRSAILLAQDRGALAKQGRRAKRGFEMSNTRHLKSRGGSSRTILAPTLFSRLPAPLQARLKQQAPRRKFPAGALIQQVGDGASGFWLIEQGGGANRHFSGRWRFSCGRHS